MQVVVLCGGMGTRIRDHHEKLPKPLIPIGGRPILWHIMKFYAHFGYKKFLLCLGYKHDAFVDYFVNYRYRNHDVTVQLGRRRKVRVHRRPTPTEDFRVTMVDTGLQTSTGSRVRRVSRYLKGERFLLTYGDGLSNVDLPSLVEFHLQSGKLATVTAVHPAGRFRRDRTRQERSAPICRETADLDRLHQRWLHGPRTRVHRPLHRRRSRLCSGSRLPGKVCPRGAVGSILPRGVLAVHGHDTRASIARGDVVDWKCPVGSGLSQWGRC